MGVKFATDAQKRAVREQKDRGRLDLGHDHASIACAGCGVQVDRGDAFTVAEGEICPACFGAREPEQKVDYSGLIGLASSWGVLGVMVAQILQENRAWFVGMAGLGWGLFGIAAFVLGVFATMTSVRLVRAGRALTAEDDPDRMQQALGMAGVIFGVLASLGAVLATIYPYLVGLNQVAFW